MILFTGGGGGGGGGGIPACTETDTPPQTPRWVRHPPELSTQPPPPGTKYTPPPGAEHAARYGQRAGGTHPTGMQTCFIYCNRSIKIKLLVNVNLYYEVKWTGSFPLLRQQQRNK